MDIIIGAGISGLYAALFLKNAIVLEKNTIGGRTNNDTFYGVSVVTGAGIGRKHKDHLLLSLLHTLKIKTKEFPINIEYSPKIHPIDVVKTTKLLKKGVTHETFKKYATQKLGKELYNQYVLSSSYSDYEKEDAYDTTHFYGMEDNKSGWTGVSIPWHDLIQKMAQKIANRIIENSPVYRIEKTANGFRVYSNKIYEARKIILATDVASVRHLLQMPIYNQICGQPFIRIYGKFDKRSAAILANYVKTHTVVTHPLQKIIPMNTEGVYMIAYADNSSALYLKQYSENTSISRKKLASLIQKEFDCEPLHLIAIKSFFWDIGTHYYTPLKHWKTRQQFINAAQHPMKDVVVVGEMVALNQGWVEGALESVHSGLN